MPSFLHRAAGPLDLLRRILSLLQVGKVREIAQLIAELREIAEVRVALGHEVIDDIRGDLPLVVRPVEGADKRRVGQANLEESAQIRLVPVDRRKRFLERENSRCRELLGHR